MTSLFKLGAEELIIWRKLANFLVEDLEAVGKSSGNLSVKVGTELSVNGTFQLGPVGQNGGIAVFQFGNLGPESIKGVSEGVGVG